MLIIPKKGNYKAFNLSIFAWLETKASDIAGKIKTKISKNV